jgi:hypothetical protein
MGRDNHRYVQAGRHESRLVLQNFQVRVGSRNRKHDCERPIVSDERHEATITLVAPRAEQPDARWNRRIRLQLEVPAVIDLPAGTGFHLRRCSAQRLKPGKSRAGAARCVDHQVALDLALTGANSGHVWQPPGPA